MRSFLFGSVGLAVALWTSSAAAQELAWRPTLHSARSAAPVRLGRPQPIYTEAGHAESNDAETQVRHAAPVARLSVARLSAPRPLVRGQSPDLPPVNVPPPPPPPGPGFGGPAVFPGGPAPGPVGLGVGEEAYNSGVVVGNADLGGFWTRMGDKFKRCWSDMTYAIDGGVGGRAMFQSDHCFDSFISPVSNPVFFEDPRALTEFRPIFIWQSTRDTNPVFAGGDNFFVILQGRVAFTEHVSLVINKLGWTWINPDGGFPGIDEGSGFSELHLGPKFTFIRNDNTGTVAAAGANFEIAAGSTDALQNTGNWSISPYFSIAQNFWRTSYGAFNFMNTTGYSLSIDSKRSDFLYSSFHLDYNILNAGKLYPLIELNWTRYTMNGSQQPFDFDGTNLFNFGSMAVAGHSDLTMALGFRYKFSEAIQLGLAGEFSLLGGSRHMEGFRIGVDMIFRY
ncbi:MAG: hypothetical protein L0Y71_08075 [Gemmataceae bacterium]|nr:hypothetical protein [Gemmataceae bacterium]